MGNTIEYESQVIGDLSKARWLVMRRMLPILIDHVNRAMAIGWNAKMHASVEVSHAGTLPPLETDVTKTPADGSFSMEDLFADRSDSLDEIQLLNCDQLERLFAWCEFLQRRDGAMALFEPLVGALRRSRAGRHSKRVADR